MTIYVGEFLSTTGNRDWRGAIERFEKAWQDVKDYNALLSEERAGNDQQSDG